MPVAELPADGRLHLRLRTHAAQVVRLAADTHLNRRSLRLSLLDLPLRPDQLLELIPERLRDRAPHS